MNVAGKDKVSAVATSTTTEKKSSKTASATHKDQTSLLDEE